MSVLLLQYLIITKDVKRAPLIIFEQCSQQAQCSFSVLIVFEAMLYIHILDSCILLTYPSNVLNNCNLTYWNHVVHFSLTTAYLIRFTYLHMFTKHV